MRFVIVTGMSGAGRSTALRALEDAGYFCVDNLPISLIEKFSELIYPGNTEVTKVALGIDIRSGKAFNELAATLEELTVAGVNYEILFLDSSDEVLVKRYKETRRTHPLAQNGRVADGIQEERKRLEFLKKQADYIIDTSNLLTRELKQELDKIFVQNKNFKNLVITVLSFGFKYGIPLDADYVFDVRFLPNPHCNPELRPMTGLDEPVAQFLLAHDEVNNFIYQTRNYIETWLPMLEQNNRCYLTIAIGCTGGKHRSVYIAQQIGEYFQAKGKNVKIQHKSLEKNKKN